MRWTVVALGLMTCSPVAWGQSAEVVALQITLDRYWYSPGCVDGRLGPRTRRALQVWQEAHGLPAHGEVDFATATALPAAPPLFVEYEVTEADRQQLGRAPLDWRERSQVPAMAYETLTELLAERFHCTERLLRELNPGATNESALTIWKVPNTQLPHAVRAPSVARLQVSLAQREVRALDAAGRVVALFPCSVAAVEEKRPVGTMTVTSVIARPNYTFDPENFPQLDPVQRAYGKLIIPPGPNNPVGAVWIGLSRPGLGIHGTPHPETVGRAESLGCFRVTNWNAERLRQVVTVGMEVEVTAE
ncbi:MAG: L,D-transpeptidase family protein [Verrucomicrobiae bacterium]|nr:L,D-transpeptidase family protein [Verrucomicrobiae bacterium]